jgi:hypothetical protein
MQIFNLTNCKMVFDQSVIPFKRLILAIYMSIKSGQKTKEDDHDYRAPVFKYQTSAYVFCIIFCLVMQEIIIHYLGATFRTASIPKKNYLWAYGFGIGIIPWMVICKSTKLAMEKFVECCKKKDIHNDELEASTR